MAYFWDVYILIQHSLSSKVTFNLRSKSDRQFSLIPENQTGKNTVYRPTCISDATFTCAVRTQTVYIMVVSM